MKFFNYFAAATAMLFLIVDPAFAEVHGAPVISDAGIKAVALAIAVVAGAFAQGRVASAALESIGRNPGAADKTFLPFIIGLALIESLVIYVLVLSFV